MADDYTIRARITGDASEFKVAMEGAAASVEANITRIKKSLEEAKATLADYQAQVKANSSLNVHGAVLPTEEAAKDQGSLGQIGKAVKEQLDAAKAGVEQTTVEIAKLEAQLKLLTTEQQSAAASSKATAEATKIAADGYAYTEKQLKLMAAASANAARATATLPALQKEAAAKSNATVTEMAALQKKADAEMTESARVLGQTYIGLGAAAQQGAELATIAINSSTDAFARAATVQQEVRAQIESTTAAQAAAADAAGVQAAVLDTVGEVTAAAALRGQDFANIQAEIAASTGKTSTELGSTYVRAHKAAGDATTALANDAKKLAPAIQQGLPAAIAAVDNLRTHQQQTAITDRELAATIKLKELAQASATGTTQAEAIAQAELQIKEAGSATEALRLAEAANVAAAGMEKVAGGANIARVAISEADGSMQGMIFALSRVAAAIPAVQTALEYAFPIITAVAFIAIIDQMIGKVGELVDAFEGFGKEEKKRLEDSIKDAQNAFSEFFKLRQEIDKNKEIGLSGIPQLGVASVNSIQQLKLLQGELDSTEARYKQLKAALEATTPEALGLFRASGQAIGEFENRALKKSGVPGTEGIESTREEADVEYTALKKKREDDAAERDKIRYVEQARIKAQINAEIFHQDIAEEEKANEVSKKLALDNVEDQKKYAKEQYTDKKITYEQETAALLTANEQQHQIEVFYAGLHENVNKQREAKGEVAKGYSQTTRIQELALEESANRQRIYDIDVQNAHEHQRSLKEIQEGNLKDLRDYINAQKDAAPEGHGERARLAALQSQQAALQNAPPGEEDDYKASERFLKEQIPAATVAAAKEAEAEVKRSVNEQYEAWIESAKRTAVEIKKYWTDIRATFLSTSADAEEMGLTVARTADIVAEADKKIAAASRLVHEEEHKVSEELKHQAELRREGAINADKANIVRKYETTPQTSLNPFALPSQEKEKQELGQKDLALIKSKQTQVDDEIAAADKAHAAAAEAAARGIQIEENANNISAEEYAKLQSKKIALDNEYQNKKAALENEKIKAEIQVYLQYYDQISSAFFKGINEWILGQKTFAAAMRDTWKGIVTAVIQDIEKIAAKWIAEHLIMLAIGRLLNQGSGQTTAAAKTIATNESEVQSYAGLAGATEFAYALAESGGDLGAALAKAAAAVAIAESFGPLAAVETGGYIPRQGVAMLHPGEVVVNHPVTSLLSNIAARGGVGSTAGAGSGASNGSAQSGGDVHLHMHTSVSTLDDHGMDRVLETHGRSMIRYFKAQMRNGRFA